MAKDGLTGEQRAEQRTKRRKRRRRKFTGFIFICFALIGVAFLVSLGVNQVDKWLDDTDDRVAYAELIAPIVALDPAPFNSIEKADPNILLEAAIYGAFSRIDAGSLRQTDDEIPRTLLPSVNVDQYAAEIYGPMYIFEHHTFTVLNDVTFEYQQETSSYIMPITSAAGSYTPVVEKITKSSNTRILTVSYMEPSDSIVGGEEVLVAKTMEYVFLREGTSHYLYAIRTPELEA